MNTISFLFSLLVLWGVTRFITSRAAYRRRMKGAKAPPGPIGLPILGSAMEFVKNPLLIPAFNKWAKTFGPLVQFTIFGENQVVISSEKMANDLLSKRGNIYSDRGAPAAVTKVAGGIITAIADKTELWRLQRKLMHSVMSIAVNGRFEPFMEIEAKYTLLDLLEDPKNFDDHLRRYAYGVLTRSGLGFAITSTDVPVVKDQEKLNNDMLALFRPDKYLCNIMPALLKLPEWMFPESRKLSEMHADVIGKIRRLGGDLRTRLGNDKTPDSLLRHFLENQDQYGLSDIEGGAVFITILGPGARSPHNALLQFIIVMMQHPEWLEKAQAEIERVVGHDRLPTFSDMPNLPIVRAVVKETIRDRSIVAEIGVPHKLSQDDYYEGYFFPAGTAFHANFSAMLTDPEMYPDGPAFNPARWLDPSYPTYKEPLTIYPNLQNFAPFGHGRRACPAYNFTERSMTMIIACIAWACDIRTPTDPATNEKVKLNIEYEPTPNPRPLPFDAELRPRSKERLELVRRVVKETLAEDPLRSEK